ncbi:sigma-70 family RNA polymerase sigma factor [Proteiniborus sp. MB09-C3]|uniref:RNA polymerase sigma factor n=1 Tax=Proteiniborus sp. MB09-C3 TaxID=3050072 RepID=UPI002555EF96|nr:sigma-70 family RNA polymerase sigma factor [Proteiniborus sp. MB09-C3]WIV10516.1 sigma-70 family RNA polymerase sigma factor [Proteiniborus sp. MB09-C3]
MFDREQNLIKKCVNGNLKAFDELIEKYEKTAYNIALRMLKNPEDAMDVSQEAFIKVFKSIKTFNFESAFSTWLYRIVTNTCLDFLRKKSTIVYSLDNPIQTEDGEMERDIPDGSHSPEELLEKKLTKELVNNAIGKLEENHRVVIILRDIQGFSYEEISNILDCSIGTVKSRINRARNNLKDIVMKEMELNKEYIV